MHLGFVSRSHLYTCTHTNTRAPQHFAGCSCHQAPAEGSVSENQVLRGHCKEKETRQLSPTREVSRERWKRKKSTKPAQNMPWKCALWAAATYWHRGRARGGRTSPRLLGQVFPTFSWHPGSEFCLPCVRVFCKTIHISIWMELFCLNSP